MASRWIDSLIALPDCGEDVWFIVGDRICIGRYGSEQKVFCMADMYGYPIADVRQWCPVDGTVHKGEYPKEGQLVGAMIDGLPCFATGVFSKHFIDTRKDAEVPGILLDEGYDVMSLPFSRIAEWTRVSEWYELPAEPLVLLPACAPATECDRLIGDCGLEGSVAALADDNLGTVAEDGVSSAELALPEDGCCSAIKGFASGKVSSDEALSDGLPASSEEPCPLMDCGFVPEGPGSEIWGKIASTGKMKEFDALLDETFQWESISEGELNDFLNGNGEYILETLGISDSPENRVSFDIDGYHESLPKALADGIEEFLETINGR